MFTNLLQSLGLIDKPLGRPVHRPSRPRPASVRPATKPVPHKGRQGNDLIAIIGFTDKAFPISLPAEPWGDKLALRVQQLPAKVGGGGTNIAAALRLALDMSRKCPKGSRRRIWLMSDGEHNIDTHDTEPAAKAINDAFINLNVIAFGEAADSTLLKSLAAKTHHGQFIPVKDLHEMAVALRGGSGTAHTKRQHRQEVAIICVDLSPSMSSDDMGGHSRISAVRDAIQSLITYKASVWA